MTEHTDELAAVDKCPQGCDRDGIWRHRAWDRSLVGECPCPYSKCPRRGGRT